jgi:small basic protein
VSPKPELAKNGLYLAFFAVFGVKINGGIAATRRVL